MDRSWGMRSPRLSTTRSRAMASTSSLATMAVGRWGRENRAVSLPSFSFGQARALQDVLGADGQLVLGHGQQIAAFAVLGVVVLPLVRDVGDPPGAHLDQHGGQLPAGLDVVVVDVDGVLQVLFGLADQDVQHPLGLQIGKDGGRPPVRRGG